MREILGSEYGWCDNEWYVRSVDVTCLKVAAALVANEDLVTREVRILVDCEAVAERADCLCTDCEWRSNLTFTIDGELWLIEDRALKDCCNVWSADHEVCRAAECLAVDCVCHVDDCLDEGLIPLADRTGEGWSD